MKFTEACIFLSAILLVCGCKSRDRNESHDQQATSSPSTGSASSTGPAQQQWSPSAYADRLARIGGKHAGEHQQIITDTDIEKILEIVRGDMVSGSQDSVADFILTEGWWHGEIWYSYAELGFSDTWYYRKYPITMAASRRTIVALEKVAGSEASDREARVEAAISILPMDKDLARSVFEKEYANFTVTQYYNGARDAIGTGDALFSLGVDAAPEITTQHYVEELLSEHNQERDNPRKPYEQERLIDAANRFNKRLREMFLKKDTNGLRVLYERPNRWLLVVQCYEESGRAATEPITEPATGTGIWGKAPTSKP